MKIVDSNIINNRRESEAQSILNTFLITNCHNLPHDYSDETFRFYPFPSENPGHARFSLLHCMQPMSGRDRLLWGSFSKCNSLV